MANTKPQDDGQVVITEFAVQVPDKLRAGAYANVVNATATVSEVALNFIYVNPKDTPQGTLVSRVIVNRDTAREMADLLKQIISTADEVDPK